MKIDKVIIALNNNLTYTGFWPIAAEVWPKYGISPLLVFYGTEKESQDLKLKDYGEVLRLEPVLDIENPSRNWIVTWGLFYAASLCGDSIVMTHGIDQIPLSNYFSSLLEKCQENKYNVCLSEAYGRQDLFPSSHHLAKGSVFKKVLGVDDDWRSEVLKLSSTRKQFKTESDGWGLDEAYSSSILKHNTETHKISNFFSGFLAPRRIDRSNSCRYSKEKLRSGFYSELHAPRPYESHKQQIDDIVNELF